MWLRIIATVVLSGCLGLPLTPGVSTALPSSAAGISSTAAARATAVSGPKIAASPLILDFGVVAVQATASRDYTVYNLGDQALVITSAFSSDPQVNAGVQLPIVIPPGGEAAGSATFSPSGGSSLSGTISLVSNAVNGAFAISVTGRGNTPPAIDPVSDIDAIAFIPLTVHIVATDLEGDPITLTATGLPVGATLNQATAELAWTPTASNAGANPLTIEASDGYASSSVTFTITVRVLNRPPVAQPGGPYTGRVDTPTIFDGSASYDPDGDLLTFSWEFGDGAGGSGATPSHTYTATGVFDVTLHLLDNGSPALGGTATTSARISPPLLPTPPPLFDATFMSFGVGDTPSSVAIGDVNRDGILDCVAANTGSSTVSVLVGIGGGMFQARMDYATGSTPSCVVLGDADGDGYLDLVTANAGANTLSVLLGTAGGMFRWGAEFPTGAVPQAVAMGDVNGDAIPDLVSANSSSYSVSVLLGNGDGTFGGGLEWATGAVPSSVAIADVTGDGVPDLVTANRVDASVSVLKGIGDGTFHAKVDFAANCPSSSVAIEDLNSDGIPDIAVAGSCVSVLLGRGGGTFGDPSVYVVRYDPLCVAIGDLDKDGKPDIVTGNLSTDDVSVLLGDGSGAFEEAINYPTGNGARAIAIGDMDGDDAQDLVTANGFDATVACLHGHGDGSFGATSFETGRGPYEMELADVNRDGHIDAATANVAQTLSVLLGSGDGTFQPTEYAGLGAELHVFALEDVSGDGIPDLVTAGNWAAAITVRLGNGDGSFRAGVDHVVLHGTAFVLTGDANGDGNPDLIAPGCILAGNGDGTFQAAVDAGSGGADDDEGALGDLDGDGCLDIVTGNHYVNKVSIFRGLGDGAFAPVASYPTVHHNVFVSIGDVNGDQKPDLVIPGSILLGNGDGTFQASTVYEWTSSLGSCEIGDLDGDGAADLAMPDRVSNTIMVYLGNGTGAFSLRTAYGAGAAPGSVAMADVDEDGRLDLVAANAGSSTVCVLRNTGGHPWLLTATVIAEPDVINMKSHAPCVTVYIEPIGFDPGRIDIRSLRLAGRVWPESKVGILGDHDRNGAKDVMVKFARAALDPLLTPGVNALEVTGSLVTGEEFQGVDTVRVINPPDVPLTVSVVPNPLNPGGILRFETSRPGPVTVRMFDLQGRLVRTLMLTPLSPAGAHELRIDGRAGGGEPLASGVYFCRVETAQGVVTERVAVLK